MPYLPERATSWLLARGSCWPAMNNNACGCATFHNFLPRSSSGMLKASTRPRGTLSRSKMNCGGFAIILHVACSVDTWNK